MGQHCTPWSAAGAAAGDLDGDGFDDLILGTRGATRCSPAGTAHPRRARQFTTGDRLHPFGCRPCDLDDDGDLDAFTGTEPNPTCCCSTTATFALRRGPPDSDGFAGRHLCRHRRKRAPRPGGGRRGAGTTIEAILEERLPGDPSSLYLQTAPGVFEGLDRLPSSLRRPPQAVGALDVDTDGDLDLYFANDFGPYIVPNMLLVNDGTGHFTL